MANIEPAKALRPQSLQARLTHLLNTWPSDPVRPESVSVRSYLQKRLSEISKEPSNGHQQQQQQSVPISEASVKALTSMLENRYAKLYPLPPNLRRPASNPDHYDNVIREFEEAPGRSWLERVRKRLTGLFRLNWIESRFCCWYGGMGWDMAKIG